MDSKDYRNLLVREIKEMSLLCESLTEVEEIPSGLLLLSRTKVESMATIIDILSKEAERKSEDQTEYHQRVDTVEETKAFFDTKEENFGDEKSVSTLGVGVVADKLEVAGGEPFVEKLVEKADDAELGSVLGQEKLEAQEAVVGIPEAQIPEVDGFVVDETEVKETIVEEPKSKVDDSMTNKKVASERRFLKPLKISIGDRFLYIKLFDNDANEMNKAVAEINKLNTFEEALDYLSQYQWDEENEGVNEFYKLLKAHFS